MQQPLAYRMRPTKIEEIVGQQHLVGEGKIIWRMVAAKRLSSMILYGPPGIGKTSIASAIAGSSKYAFRMLNAATDSQKDLQIVAEEAKMSGAVVLLLDEIHRLNKVKQDFLLPYLESGAIILIGATTENPSFEVNSALLSRCQVYTLNSLDSEAIQTLLNNALQNDRFLKERYIHIEEYDALLQFAAGDARKALNLLDLIASTFEPEVENTITNAVVVKVAQQNIARYDKSGEQHYDLVSAFIKSIRGSDPDAALYWMARMLKGGEDPVFIARRMLIAASEDIGNSNPNALLLAGECFRSVQAVGMPEARIILGQTAVYLATSAKSNSTYLAINKALELAEKTANLPVPLHLRNAPTKLMKQQGYGINYLYPHDYPEHFVLQDYLPPELKGTKLYESARNKREVEGERLQQRRWQQEQ